VAQRARFGLGAQESALACRGVAMGSAEGARSGVPISPARRQGALVLGMLGVLRFRFARVAGMPGLVGRAGHSRRGGASCRVGKSCRPAGSVSQGLGGVRVRGRARCLACWLGALARRAGRANGGVMDAVIGRVGCAKGGVPASPRWPFGESFSFIPPRKNSPGDKDGKVPRTWISLLA
jgi:hypothetical protein